VLPEILEECLLPTAAQVGGNPWRFLIDGASIHKSKSTKSWFAQRNIELIPWASYSPDMNPTENAWGSLSNIVYANGRVFNDLPALRKAVLKAWREMSQESLQHLIDGMQVRVHKLIEAKGAWVGY